MYLWRCKTYEFDTKMPIVMGILNLTPDSFSDGGQYTNADEAVAAAHAMVEAGASVIDVGGESTRPGAVEVAADEECARVLGVVSTLAAEGVCVSIDTRHVAVARAAVEAGAAVINDVSGFTDPAMVELAASCDAGLVVVHAGNHFTGAQAAEAGEGAAPWRDMVTITVDFLKQQAAALEAAGVARERICLDPGPGFGKTVQETVDVMRNLHEVARLGYPVMVAVSRKSYLGEIYGIDNAADRDDVSAAEALMACELGAGVVRAHNVEKTMSALADLRPYVFLGLGCNVALVADEGEEREGKIAQLNHAIGQLCSLPDSQLIDISGFYESEPAYYLEQDKFVNAVVLLRSGIAPKELLTYLHAIENSLGRVREIENGPRTCDIDILDYQLYVVDSDVLTLPHPLICERDFVVKPFAELRPRHVLANGTRVDSVPQDDRCGYATRI